MQMFFFLVLGVSYVANGQLMNALNSYNEAFNLDPFNHKITYNMGNLVCYYLNVEGMSNIILYLYK